MGSADTIAAGALHWWRTNDPAAEQYGGKQRAAGQGDNELDPEVIAVMDALIGACEGAPTEALLPEAGKLPSKQPLSSGGRTAADSEEQEGDERGTNRRRLSPGGYADGSCPSDERQTPKGSTPQPPPQYAKLLAALLATPGRKTATAADPTPQMVPAAAWPASGAWYVVVPLMEQPPAERGADCGLALDWSQLHAFEQGYQELPGEDPGTLSAALQHRLVLTRYNGWLYSFAELSEALTIDSVMPPDPRQVPQAAEPPSNAGQQDVLQGTTAKAPDEGAEEAEEEGVVEESTAASKQMEGGGEVSSEETEDEEEEGTEEMGKGEDETPLTFREYYSDKWGVTDIPAGQRMLVVHRGRSAAPVFLVPQLCLLYPLPHASCQIAQCVPRLLWWLQGLLRADELRTRLLPPGLSPNMCPSTAVVHEALTSRACEEDFSYERMETMGDAVLKYEVSAQLYDLHPTAHEGQLASRKDARVSNFTLARIGERLALGRYLSAPFKPRYVLAQAPSGPPLRKGARLCSLRRKALADCMEALIGSFYVTGGEPAALAFLHSVNALPTAAHTGTPIEGASLPAVPCPAPQEDSSLPLSAIEIALSYRFRQPQLLKEALTHCSWPEAGSTCYQRLEFLGDAVLDLLITRHIFDTYPNLPPGLLHDLRSASVNNERLAACAAVHRLHAPLRHFSPKLFLEVEGFLNGMRTAANLRSIQELTAERKGKPQQEGSSYHDIEAVPAAPLAHDTGGLLHRESEVSQLAATTEEHLLQPQTELDPNLELSVVDATPPGTVQPEAEELPRVQPQTALQPELTGREQAGKRQRPVLKERLDRDVDAVRAALLSPTQRDVMAQCPIMIPPSAPHSPSLPPHTSLDVSSCLDEDVPVPRVPPSSSVTAAEGSSCARARVFVPKPHTCARARPYVIKSGVAAAVATMMPGKQVTADGSLCCAFSSTDSARSRSSVRAAGLIALQAAKPAVEAALNSPCLQPEMITSLVPSVETAGLQTGISTLGAPDSLTEAGCCSPTGQRPAGGEPLLLSESPELLTPEIWARVSKAQMLPAGSLGSLRLKRRRTPAAAALSGRALLLDSAGQCYVSATLNPAGKKKRRRVRLLYSSEMGAALKLPSWLADTCGRLNRGAKSAGDTGGDTGGVRSGIVGSPSAEEGLNDRAMMARRQAAYSWASAAGFSKSGAGAPKVMADVMESITGAVFLDTGRDLDATWAVIEPLLRPLVTPETAPVHPVRDLHERCSKLGLSVTFRTERPPREAGAATPGKCHRARMVVSVAGEEMGSCAGALHRQAARMLAAKDALSRWPPPAAAATAEKLRRKRNSFAFLDDD